MFNLLQPRNIFSLLLLSLISAAAMFSLALIKPQQTPAAVGCGFSPSSLSVGGSLNVLVTDLPGNNEVRLYTFGSFVILGNVNGGSGVPSTGGNSFTIPSSATAPEYQVRIRTPFGGEINCGPGNLTITGAGAGCSISPTTGSIGDSFTVNVTDLPGNNVARLYPFGGPSILLGNISGSPGIPSFGARAFTIPSSATLPQYQVRVETPFGGEINCGNLTITDGSGGGGGGTTDCTSFEECSDVVAPIDSGGQFPGRESGFLGQLINQILPVAIGLGAFLSVIMIVISGIQFIGSSGNPEGAAAARGRLTFALVGFALLALAYGITVVIDRVFLSSGVI